MVQSRGRVRRGKDEKPYWMLKKKIKKLLYIVGNLKSIGKRFEFYIENHLRVLWDVWPKAESWLH